MSQSSSNAYANRYMGACTYTGIGPSRGMYATGTIWVPASDDCGRELLYVDFLSVPKRSDRPPGNLQIDRSVRCSRDF